MLKKNELNIDFIKDENISIDDLILTQKQLLNLALSMKFLQGRGSGVCDPSIKRADHLSERRLAFEYESIFGIGSSDNKDLKKMINDVLSLYESVTQVMVENVRNGIFNQNIKVPTKSDDCVAIRQKS